MKKETTNKQDARITSKKKNAIVKSNVSIIQSVDNSSPENFDNWIEQLDGSTKESLYEFSQNTFSSIQVYVFAKFLGYDGSITSVDKWVRTTYPKPDHLSVLMYEIKEMQEDVRKLREDIENFTVKRDNGVARIAQMQREIRGTIELVDKTMSTADRKSLLLTGADRAIRELLYIFKDDPIEVPLYEASMSVWAKIQYEP